MMMQMLFIQNLQPLMNEWRTRKTKMSSHTTLHIAPNSFQNAKILNEICF